VADRTDPLRSLNVAERLGDGIVPDIRALDLVEQPHCRASKARQA
jgi:hypothetical protein